MAKQTFLPGTEPPSIPALDEAMARYQELKTERMELTKQEVEAKAKVAELMKAHKLKAYKDEADDLIASIEAGEPKVKVKRVPGSNGDEEEEDD